ncbi:MAG: pyridoxal 5'-phosphate synthase glutaminase subunit PdxT [Dehalococcoidia bacterium]|nr:pyridoxal 5'-phosphate synthase glutaminase subunit PdxT [Dehalococcoidia bacterium]
MSLKVGVLALQGAFAEHFSMLNSLEAEATEVRLVSQLEGLDGLIVPGGESTTISNLMSEYGLLEPLKELAKSGFPVMGICAGLILLGRLTTNSSYPLSSYKTMGVMDVVVKRNAFGRQVDSFEADLPIPSLGKNHFHCVFIRAPLIENVGAGVNILCQLPDNSIVAARQGNLITCAFHPELTDDLRFHRYFLNIVKNSERTSEACQTKK